MSGQKIIDGLKDAVAYAKRPPAAFDAAPWPDPTPEQLASPEFEAIWQAIKRWDINVPTVYCGHMSATGNHVRAILDALDRVRT